MVRVTRRGRAGRRPPERAVARAGVAAAGGAAPARRGREAEALPCQWAGVGRRRRLRGRRGAGGSAPKVLLLAGRFHVM
eukprot:COSAG03_NODE_1500_length_3974_cov_33.983226_3_plen_79_part_00